MLAHRIKLNVFDHDHLRTLSGKNRVVGNLLKRHAVTASQEIPGFRHALRCFQDALAVGVLTDDLEPIVRQVREPFAANRLECVDTELSAIKFIHWFEHVVLL